MPCSAALDIRRRSCRESPQTLTPVIPPPPPTLDRVRDIPASLAHGERGEDDHQPAGGVAPAHPGFRRDSDSGRASHFGSGDAALEH